MGRFNERFILSLGVNPHCIVVDDELNILPISSHVRSIKKVKIVGADGQVSLHYLLRARTVSLLLVYSGLTNNYACC